MRYHVFEEGRDEYPVCILVDRINEEEIRKNYIEPYQLLERDVIILSLYLNPNKKKTPVRELKEYASELLPVIQHYKSTHLIIAHGDYFKLLTGSARVEENLGYVLDIVDAPSPMVGVYVPSLRSMFYDPVSVTAKIERGIRAIQYHRVGCYVPPGNEIIKNEYYPTSLSEIGDWLDKLTEMNVPLAVDIEGFSLRAPEAGIGTIAFAWNQNEGVAFSVDYVANQDGIGEQQFNEDLRVLLRRFFENFGNTLRYHNAGYDICVLIYQLYMKDIADTKGLRRGLEVMMKDWDDTKIIAYLATNSCAGNELGLKAQAQEFAGNWAQDDIKDIRQIPEDKLLRYNLVDTLSTNYVYDKHWQIVLDDDQLDIYLDIFKPALVDIIEMQLTGLPLNMKRTVEVESHLTRDREDAMSRIQSSPLVQEFIHNANEQWVINKNNTLKVKRVTIDDANESFNPNSPAQLQTLLYEQIGLPVLEVTASKQPATGSSILKSLMNHTQNQDVLDLLQALRDFKAVDKILTAFIPAFLDAYYSEWDDWHYLCGNFNIGGTVSGRLSSSGPNLQQLPSGGKYGSLIKSCFQAPPGWLLVGLDFNSLEDMISALTTKDKNKLKVYLDGYDGHSLRAFSYFGELMPDIKEAPEGEMCYHFIAEDENYYAHETEIVDYCGTKMTGKELYELLTNS